jgi:hypothetical protein
MEWHQYLREERAQKITGLMRFLAGDLSMVATHHGGQVDTTEVTVARLRRNIVEIEQILTAAGVPLDEDDRIIVPLG